MPGEGKNEMLKQVQHDKDNIPRPLGRGIKGEGLSHSIKAAFTLAEVLITLGIIGIVAAMTIPTLVANYQSKAWNTSSQVFVRKLEEALKTMNTQQTLAGYRNTTDFVAELGKHFKITRVCKNDDIMSCFEDKVLWGKNELEVSTENVKTAAGLGQHDWNTETIGVQFANGTTGIIAYNPECKENPFTNQFTGTSCLALLYDTDGFKKPNADGKDLRYINVTEIDGHKPCSFEISGTCYTAPFYPTPLTKAECESLKDDLGIRNCFFDDDYWAGAVKACGGKDNMPNTRQISNLANYTRDNKVDLGFTLNGEYYYLWSNVEYSSGRLKTAYGAEFNMAGRYLSTIQDRQLSHFQAVCLAE